jgi:hypothetical protein
MISYKELANGAKQQRSQTIVRALMIAMILSGAFVADGQSCIDSPSGLVSWWTGDLSAEDRVGANPAILQNGTSYTAGEVDQSFYFDGVANYISIPASTSLDVGPGEGLTIECWIRPDDLSDQHILAEWNDGGGNVGAQFQISIPLLGGLGSIFANMLDTGGHDHYFATSPNVLSLGVWQHVAVTYDSASGNSKIYYNGTPIAGQNLGSFIPQTTYALYLGKRISGPGTGSYFQGAIDEVSLYARALSDSEILDIYGAGSAGKCKSQPPTILSQPVSRTVRQGAQVTFTVAASGSSLSYQWRFNGLEMSGATDSALVLHNVQGSDAGNYSVVITNLFGSVTSSDANLAVTNFCVAAAQGLISWWAGEGGSEDSFGSNPAVLHNNVTFVPGESGQAFQFDGVGAYISVPASAMLDVGRTSGLTIECWIKPSDVSSQHILTEWNNGAGSVGVQLQFSVAELGGLGSLLANVLDTNGNNHLFASSPNLITTNSFQHVALTYDKATGIGKLYRNGIVVASQNLGVFTPQTSFDLYMGKRVSGPGAGSYYNGLLDEVSLYNRALTDAEIQTIFYSGSAGKACLPPEIVAHPSSQQVRLGSTVTFSEGVRGGLPLAYQWQLNGSNVSGATNALLTVTNVQPSNAGNYRVVVTNAFGTATSSNALLKITVVLAYADGQPLTSSQYNVGSPISIQLTNLYPNGLIFYSLDGSAPTIASPQYSGPFAVTHSVVLRALAYSPDFLQAGELDPPVAINFVPTYTLSVTSGGGGTVTLNPPGGHYLSNSVVSLSANPASGWMFLQWIGDSAGTNPATSINMSRNKSVQAVFGTTLNTTIAGNGSLALNPPGGIYPYGTTVWVTGIPLAGSYFGFWGSAASGNSNPLAFLVTNANSTISSIFGSVSTGQAALSVVSVGNGQISVNPRANIYTSGQSVTITATPNPGQLFLGWSGDATGTQNPLSLTLDQSKLVYANFSHKPRLSAQGGFVGLNSEGFELLILGDYGASYEIDETSNFLTWSTLGTVTNLYGTSEFLDRSATNRSRGSYRAMELP